MSKLYRSLFTRSLVLVALASCAQATSSYRDQQRELDTLTREQAALDDGRDLFAEGAPLELSAVVAAAIERNPTVQAAREGWRAALERYPQASSFEDPTLSYLAAPLSIGSSDVDYGHVVELSVPLPFPGKRRLRGQVALAEADAARFGVDAARLRVAQLAAQLYFELYAIERAIVITTEFERELEAHRRTLTAHLAAGHAWQDDALKVEVDLGEATQRRLDLEGQRLVVSAQLNELLHRAPEIALPALPETLPTPAPLEQTSAQLQTLALETRPELRAADSRVAVGDARVAVASRDFYPDFRVVGRYNSMWPTLEHDVMAGVALTLPLWRGRREASRNEARANRSRADAQRQGISTRIRSEVERAVQARTAALAVLEKYRDDILPAARDRAKAIRVGLDSGRTTFLEVLRADHDLLTVSLRHELALANVHRRQTDLEAALGGSISGVVLAAGSDR